MIFNKRKSFNSALKYNNNTRKHDNCDTFHSERSHVGGRKQFLRLHCSGEWRSKIEFQIFIFFCIWIALNEVALDFHETFIWLWSYSIWNKSNYDSRLPFQHQNPNDSYKQREEIFFMLFQIVFKIFLVWFLILFSKKDVYNPTHTYIMK